MRGGKHSENSCKLGESDAEFLKVFDAEVVTGDVEERVQHRTAVPRTEDEAVAVEPSGFGWTVAEVAGEKNVSHVTGAEREARVTTVRFLDGIAGKEPYRRRAFNIRGVEGVLGHCCFTWFHFRFRSVPWAKWLMRPVLFDVCKLLPGQMVQIIGNGGVSVLALQKLQRVRDLGAEVGQEVAGKWVFMERVFEDSREAFRFLAVR